MLTPNPKPPRIGERVAFQQGVYIVIAVDFENLRATLQLSHSEHVEAGVPWGTFESLEAVA